ncbi:MAG TPA: hypothetical protein VK009_28595 [Chloroflexota bacterium]|nr:hypothetical protein [Chloroflexota bacterium]
MKPKPRMVQFYEGWAAMADSWMVCALSHNDAWRRYVAAELHGQPPSKRLPIWMPWLCWLTALEVAVMGMIDGGGRLNAGLFFALGVGGFVAMFAHPLVFCWVFWVGEVAFVTQMYWSHPNERYWLGPGLVFVVVAWLLFMLDRRLLVSHCLRVWVRQRRSGQRHGGLVARR